MKREKQDYIWDFLLPDDFKNEVIMTYETHKPICAQLVEDTDWAREVRRVLEDLFGKQHLDIDTMIKEEQDKVLQALEYFRTHATEEQKKEAWALLEKDCRTDITLKDYVKFKPVTRIINWNK